MINTSDPDVETYDLSIFISFQLPPKVSFSIEYIIGAQRKCIQLMAHLGNGVEMQATVLAFNVNY